MTATAASKGEDGDRRRYWAQQMDAAYEFMMAAQRHPVTECGEPMASLPEAAEAAGVAVAFSPLKHVLGRDRIFFLRTGLVEPFVRVAKAMNGRGWLLVVEDVYRTPFMQKHLAMRQDIFDTILRKVVWELGGAVPDRDLLARRVAALVAMNPKTGTHTCGSAMDVSVHTLAPGKPGTLCGEEIDRGGPYIELSEKTPMASPFVSPAAASNRRQISEIMSAHGFCAYPFEFWHYSQGDVYDAMLSGGRRAARYGPVEFDAATGQVSPVKNPTLPLNSPDEIEDRIRQSLARK